MKIKISKTLFFHDGKKYGAIARDVLYMVSDSGEVWNCDTRHNLNAYKCGKHLAVDLLMNGEFVLNYIHRLVAEVFLINKKNKSVVHHINNNPKDNRPCNLIWLTKSEHRKVHILRDKNQAEYMARISELRSDSPLREFTRTYKI